MAKLRKHKERIPIDHPELFEKFKAHCEAGWSPRTFMMQIQGTSQSYYFLIKSDLRFKELHEKYKQPCHTSYYAKLINA